MTSTDSVPHASKARPAARPQLPGQIVLVMQGGGAPGCYQAGVYQALHEAGIEPDWIVGTSIGAINGAIIGGNKVEHRRAPVLWAEPGRSVGGRSACRHRAGGTLFGRSAQEDAAGTP